MTRPDQPTNVLGWNESSVPFGIYLQITLHTFFSEYHKVEYTSTPNGGAPPRGRVVTCVVTSTPRGVLLIG